MTLKGVAAADVASMVGVVFSEELPGMLRRRPVFSGGDSAEKEKNIHVKKVIKFDMKWEFFLYVY